MEGARLSVALHTVNLIDQIFHADICAGGGGFGLALKIAVGERARTVVYVEREAYAAATLVARMANEALDDAPVWDCIESFDGKPWRGKVHILTAGFPCQPFSLAGKRRGTRDERWLWDDLTRIIREFRCPFVFLENVPGLTLTERDGKGWALPAGLWHVLGDLAALGFDAEWCCVRAADLNSSHERARIFIMGYSSKFARAPQPRRVGSRRAETASTGRPEANGGSDQSGAALGNAACDDKWRGANGTHRTRQSRRRSSSEVDDASSSGRSYQPTQQGSVHERSESGGTSAQLAHTGRGSDNATQPECQPQRNRSTKPGTSRAELENSEGERTRQIPNGRLDTRRREATDLDGRSDTMVHAMRRGQSERRRTKCGTFNFESARLPVFPPGPGLGGYGVLDNIRELQQTEPQRAWRQYQSELRNTLEWCRILEDFPALEPAIRGVADELAPRVDRLRLTGGGVVPLAAAIAFHILSSRLGVTL